MKHKLLCLLLCLTAVFAAAPSAAASGSQPYTVAEVEALCDGIVGYKEAQWGVSSPQALIDKGLSETAGVSAEFYIIALSQSGGYRFSAYENALRRYLDTHEVYSATSREKYALALIASGSNHRYIRQTADEAIGGQGLMSLVFGLHILNNGYPSRMYSASGLINAILGCQLSDGGWAVIGNRGDADVTAMTLQALAPYYHADSDVNAAIERALTMLSQAQRDSGGFFGMGTENCESSAQVLCALSDLGIDQNTDARFIKNANTVLDAMLRYRNADGSFSHTGGGFNETATMQALYSLTAYRRYLRGQGPLYVLDRRSPSTAEPPEEPTQKPQPTAAAPTQNSGSGGSWDADRDNGSSVGNQNSGDRQDTPRQDSSSVGQPTEKPTADRATEASQTISTQSPTAALTEPPTDNAPVTQATAGATADEAASPKKGGYKPYAVAAVLAAALIAACVLYLLKKRGKKRYLAIVILTSAAILFILLTNFESPQSYRTVAQKTDAAGTVTMTIRCDAVKDDEKPSYIPDDCIILDTTEFTISEGDTAYDILLEASKRYGIPIDNRGSAANAYIAGIGSLYEYEYGELSGWMYRVNGVFPEVGCQSCTLSAGDAIEWLYTKNIGKDLK